MDTTKRLLKTKQSYEISIMSFPFHRHNTSNNWHFPVSSADYSKTCFMIKYVIHKTKEATFHFHKELEGIVVISWLIYNRQFQWTFFFHFLQNMTAICDIRCTNHYFVGA